MTSGPDSISCRHTAIVSVIDIRFQTSLRGRDLLEQMGLQAQAGKFNRGTAW